MSMENKFQLHGTQHPMKMQGYKLHIWIAHFLVV